MSDERPVLPWLDPGSEASAELRAVLESARGDGLSAARAEALAAKVLALSAPAAVAASSAPAATSAALSTGAKVTVATLVLCLGGVSAWVLHARLAPRSPRPSAAPWTAREVASPVLAPRPAQPQRAPADPDRAPPAIATRPLRSQQNRVDRPRVPPLIASAPRVEASAIEPPPIALSAAEDAALLHRAAAALRGGESGAAIALVAQHRRLFATSLLSEERERIEVEALVRDGQLERARRAGERFRALFPGSAQQPRIDALLSRDAAP